MPEAHARFRSVFDQTYTPVQAYVRRRIDAAEVDDVLAEVFTVAWRPPSRARRHSPA
jgi:DNA-directed RNA polymerase specialized sigma24 family protein